MRCTVFLQSVLFSDPYHLNCFYRMYVCMYRPPWSQRPRCLRHGKKQRGTHIQGLLQGGVGVLRGPAARMYVQSPTWYVHGYCSHSTHV